MRRLVRLFCRLALVALLLFVLWLGGLAWFVASSLRIADARTLPTDAVVVLTGGRLRLETGLGVLIAGSAKKLFVSGVNQKIDRDELLRVLGPAAGREACCIVIGHEADNTFGNARETAAWMEHEGYRSLRLVTSWYHMRRSLLEFGRRMPQTRVVAHPVFIHHHEREGWAALRVEGLLIIGEYDKFLAAWVSPIVYALYPPARVALEESRR